MRVITFWHGKFFKVSRLPEPEPRVKVQNKLGFKLPCTSQGRLSHEAINAHTHAHVPVAIIAENEAGMIL